MSRKCKKIGKRNGRLIVQSTATIQGRTYYICLCDCGKETIIQCSNFISGSTVSCGCFQKEQVTLRSSKKPGEAIKKSIWHYYRRNAKTRHLTWELTFEQFLSFIFSPCHYCATIGGTITKQRGNSLAHNGIDRFYNDEGYSIKNCVTCCKRCNIAKSNMHPRAFEEWLQNVYSNLFEGNQ